MRRLLLGLMLPAICLVLPAETTGRITGKVVNKEGKPLPGARLVLKRTDRNWSKEMVADKNGTYLQVGLDPQTFELTVTAEGYTEFKETIKIPLGDVLRKDVTLLTAAESRAQAIASGAVVQTQDPGQALDAEGRDAFNLAIPLYNEAKYGEALPLMEKSHKALTEALGKTKDETAKADLAQVLTKVERVLGICMGNAGADKALAEPFLQKAYLANPKDQPVLNALVKVAQAKADAAAEKKYAGELEALTGPDPATSYNRGVEAFNAGNTKEAKKELQRALEISPKYAEAHFLLAMVAFGDNDLKGTKVHLEKYLELAPAGKNAGMAREMLKDPSLKKIK